MATEKKDAVETPPEVSVPDAIVGAQEGMDQPAAAPEVNPKSDPWEAAYIVNSTLRHDGVRYKAGDSIRADALDDGTAEKLLQMLVIRRA